MNYSSASSQPKEIQRPLNDSSESDESYESDGEPNAEINDGRLNDNQANGGESNVGEGTNGAEINDGQLNDNQVNGSESNVGDGTNNAGTNDENSNHDDGDATGSTFCELFEVDEENIDESSPDAEGMDMKNPLHTVRLDEPESVVLDEIFNGCANNDDSNGRADGEFTVSPGGTKKVTQVIDDECELTFILGKNAFKPMDMGYQVKLNDPFTGNIPFKENVSSIRI